MSEISEEATNLIDNFEYAVEDAVSDYTMACGASQKHQARRNLEDYIAELEAARRWIPVSERLPKEKQSVLALDRTGTAYHWEYSKCLSNIFVGYYTHWMPLPEPPEVK